MLGNFAYSFLSADIFFQNQLFRKISFRNTTRVSNSLDPDQARHFVRPDLDPNFLRNSSSEDSSRQRVKPETWHFLAFLFLNLSYGYPRVIFNYSVRCFNIYKYY